MDHLKTKVEKIVSTSKVQEIPEEAIQAKQDRSREIQKSRKDLRKT